MTPNYHATLHPLILLCKSLGMSPLTPKKFPRLYTTSIFAAYTLEAIYILSRATNVVEEIGIYPKPAVLLFCILMATLQIVGVANSYLQRRIFARFLRGVSEIDLSLELDYKQSKNYKVLLMMFLSGLIRSAATMDTVKIDTLSQVIYYKATLIKSLLKYKATILMGDINYRYVGLAKKLEEKGNVAKLARLHFKLRNCTQQLLRSCGAEIVFCILASTWNIGFQSYCLYISCTRLNCLETWSHLASPLAWISEEFFEMYRLVKACFDTCQSANRFPVLLHELRYAEPELGCEVYQLSLKFLHQKLELSAVGFFKLDYGLIYSVITAITTYLVIFIQYDLNYQ